MTKLRHEVLVNTASGATGPIGCPTGVRSWRKRDKQPTAVGKEHRFKAAVSVGRCCSERGSGPRRTYEFRTPARLARCLLECAVVIARSDHDRCGVGDLAQNLLRSVDAGILIIIGQVSCD